MPNKQKLIKNLIQKQYDQLLEICEQTKAEIEYLSKDVEEGDLTQSLDIEQTRNLISSIEQDIQVKKRDIRKMEIKNRYQQLLCVYQTTLNETALLENLLQTNYVGGADSARFTCDYDLFSAWINCDKMPGTNQFPEPKRERLNLTLPMTTAHHSSKLYYQYENMVAARLERLENLAFKLDQQPTYETFNIDAGIQLEETGPQKLVEKVAVETTSIESKALEEPEIPKPLIPEVKELVTILPTSQEGLIAPEISEVVIDPTAPAGSISKSEIKKQSKSREVCKPENKTSLKKRSPFVKKIGYRTSNIIFNVIFFLVLVFLIIIFILFGHRDPHVMGFSVMRIATSSM